jgi:hypothetical protein
MSALGALATLVMFQTPAAGKMPSNTVVDLKQMESVRFIPYAVPAFGAGALFSVDDFERVWTALYGESPHLPSCGQPKVVTGSERALVEADSFLVAMRGFLPELCKADSWYVSSMRLDPCRIRLGKENHSLADVQRCAQDGKFSEIRFVLQPVLKHDRGFFFPDVALHAAFSFRNFSKAISIWESWNSSEPKSRWKRPQGFFEAVRRHSFPNDVSLFISGAGQERWTFARVINNGRQWTKDKLFHGGFHESLTDAEPDSVGLRTSPATGVRVFSQREFLEPLSSTPLQGSCIGCHLAPPGRAARAFRHFGWGLAGEPVVSARVFAEAEFASRELKFFGKISPRK